MRNRLTEKNLSERAAGRTLLAFSLAASLAAFGCTTNRTPGNGEPLRSGPGVGPNAPTSGVTSGSSSGTTTYQPMTSSSQHLDPLPTTTARARRLPLSPDEAAAVLAGNQYSRGVRVLGPVNPGQGRGYVSEGVMTGQFQDPVNQLGGIVTVNSSVNSVAHVPALAGGDGGVGVGALSGVTAGSTVAGTGVTGGVPVTPTTAAIAVTPGTFSAGPGAAGVTPSTAPATSNTGTLTPTVASSVVPQPTVSSSATVTGRVRTAPVTAAATSAATGTRTGTAVPIANPVRITQDTSGRVVVTNTKQQ